MAIQVTLNGETFQIPIQGQNPAWGEQLTDLLQALVNAANSASGPADILLTSFNVSNNVASPTNITGAAFDTSQVRSFIMQYDLYRSTNSNELSEVGHLYGTYKSSAGTWELNQSYAGSSGITFSMTNGGQLQYTSSNMAGTGYVGKMKFKATSFLQA